MKILLNFIIMHIVAVGGPNHVPTSNTVTIKVDCDVYNMNRVSVKGKENEENRSKQRSKFYTFN